MKSIPFDLQALLDSGASTLCYCWKVIRRDGTVQGFTEHDRNLTFGGVTFLASSGFTASRVQQNLGLAVDNLSLHGALDSATINEDDLAEGRYDNADVELYWVDFTNVVNRVLVSSGSIGEVKRMETAFEAEFRSLANKLAQKTGRTYQRFCNANVGDSRCKVNLNNPLYRAEGGVTVASGRFLTVTGLTGFSNRWFEHGLLRFTSGNNSGLSFEIKAQTSTSRLELWQLPPNPVLSADEFVVTAGCRQDNLTCRTKFNNLVNFRGFPFMPGNDTVQAYPVEGEGKMDGGSLGLGR